MVKSKKIERLNRFTTLPILLDLLEGRKLVLLDPSTWEDRNDTLIIEEYKKRANIQNLFALCFTHWFETIHHWKAFANGSSGCCIEFYPIKLFKIFGRIKELRHGVVNYIKITDAKSFAIVEIPFTKRMPYEFEHEYRVIWEGTSDNKFLEIPIPLTTIKRITMSQQMPESVFQSVKALIALKYPSLKGSIFRSTIYENKTWVNKFRKKV
jgi:hypothetical protein